MGWSQPQWGGASWSLEEDKLFKPERAELEEWPKYFGGFQKVVSGSQLDTELFTAGVWFCFDLIVTVHWAFPLEESI